MKCRGPTIPFFFLTLNSPSRQGFFKPDSALSCSAFGYLWWTQLTPLLLLASLLYISTARMFHAPGTGPTYRYRGIRATRESGVSIFMSHASCAVAAESFACAYERRRKLSIFFVLNTKGMKLNNEARPQEGALVLSSATLLHFPRASWAPQTD